MDKRSGGTRNYSKQPRTLKKRHDEFDALMNTGVYDFARSFFDPSGGFAATHNEHNQVIDPAKDKSDVAVQYLAAKGYRLYLDSEKTTISDSGKKKDGRIEKLPMDIKTINNAGKSTIKRACEEAAKQGARCVILFQNTSAMDRKYVSEQLYGKDGFLQKSPIKMVRQIDWVIVVGSNGHVHRHALFSHRL